ncbi:MAG: helix-turn-helix transcriptional regulator [Colwellia sp.]|nr:helix-turn-helix transcriptional regulator [Colwellia sp.]
MKSIFIRRFRKSTGEKSSYYLQRFRVESVKSRLINNDDSTKTIALGVGYTDYNYFTAYFYCLFLLLIFIGIKLAYKVTAINIDCGTCSVASCIRN